MEMTDNQGNTYTPLEGRRPIDSPEVDNIPPRDANLSVYIGLVMAGIGFVLPYNSFIIASDFWQTRFPAKPVALDMSMTYIIVAFATVLLNNVFLSLFSFKVRILFGYMISLSTFLFVSICEVAIEVFSAQTAYSANLAAVSLTAIGCTVQQSSFYGFASMFPKQYTQAVMTGESLAGFVVALTRIFTKIVIANDRVSTFFFLLMSVCYIAASYAFHSVTIHSPFVRYHTRKCAKIVLRPDEDRVLSDGETSTSATAKYGIVSLESSNGSPATTQSHLVQTQLVVPSHQQIPTATGLSFSNPVYELSNPSAGESILEDLNNQLPDTMSVTARQNEATASTPSVAYKVEHILTPGVCTSSRFGDFKSGLESRWRVAHAIYPYMVSIALAYCVTLSLYPGIETEIISCHLKSWMPVLLMFTFNSADLMGKMIAIVPYNWTRRQLILLSGMRTCLIPLLLLCCAPRQQPVIAGEAAAFVFSAALGITNGLAGSLPMMLAPAKVPATLKEVTGNMMTLSYNVGLTAGSLIGYVFESMLGPQIINPCPSYPYIPLRPDNNGSIFTASASTTIIPQITTTTTAATIMAAAATAATSTTSTSNIIGAATSQSFSSSSLSSTISSFISSLTTTPMPQIFQATTAATSSISLTSTVAAAAVTTGANLFQHVTNLPAEATSTKLFTTFASNITEAVFNTTTQAFTGSGGGGSGGFGIGD